MGEKPNMLVISLANGLGLGLDVEQPMPLGPCVLGQSDEDL